MNDLLIYLGKLLAVLALTLPLAAQQVTYTVTCPTNAQPGSMVTCPLGVTGGPAMIEGTVTITPAVPGPTWNMTVLAANKQVSTGVAPSNVFVIYTQQACTTLVCADTPIGAGPVANIVFTMPSVASQVTITAPVATDANGAILTTSVGPAALIALGPPPNNCDLNNDGVVTWLDVTAAVNRALVNPTSANVSAIMKVVNASFGAACTL